MYIVDQSIIQEAIKRSGYRSIGNLAKSLGIHRNTLHHYLSGHGVFPEALEKIIRALDLKPADVLIDKDKIQSFSLAPIAPVIDQLTQEFPNITFILFGSRPKGKAHKYSDWDIGVFSKSGISHEHYRLIVRRKNELVEDLAFFVDIANLNQANKTFLKEIANHWSFLAGRLQDWIELQRKVAA